MQIVGAPIVILFGIYIAGMLLAAVLAAIMSTLSAQLLVCSSSLTQDLYKTFLRKNASQRELVWKQFGWLGLYEIVPGFLFASRAIYGVSLADREPDAAVLATFDEVEGEIQALRVGDRRRIRGRLGGGGVQHRIQLLAPWGAGRGHHRVCRRCRHESGRCLGHRARADAGHGGRRRDRLAGYVGHRFSAGTAAGESERADRAAAFMGSRSGGRGADRGGGGRGRAGGSCGGWSHPSWAAIGAVAVMQGGHLHVTMHRALQRMAGTLAGALLVWLILAAEPPFWVIVGFIVAFQFITEIIIGFNYALGQITVTPGAA